MIKNEEHYPAQQVEKFRFGGDLEVSFRLIQPGDADLLTEFFHSHSKRTIIYRYFTPLRELTAGQIHKFVDLDFENDTAIIGLASIRGHKRMVCVGRYFRDQQSNSAELAITVHDDLQRRGLGTFLLRQLIRIARAHGIDKMTADVIADNHGMMALLRNCSRNLEISLEAGVYHVEFPVL
jgi:GNAT superfamily N-acetyltransferase